MSNELMTTNNGGGLNVMSRIAEFQQVAKLFAESGMFSDAKGAAQCFVKIMAGAELGLPPFTAMNAFHVIQGKPVMTANTIAARLKSSGKYNYRIIEKSSTKCVIDFYEGKDKVHQESWDTARANKAGVKNMDKYPEAMLFARAVTAGARAVAPDVVGQFYTPDEVGAEVDADGVIISTPATEPPAIVKHEPAKIEAPQLVDVTDQYVTKPALRTPAQVIASVELNRHDEVALRKLYKEAKAISEAAGFVPPDQPTKDNAADWIISLMKTIGTPAQPVIEGEAS